MGIEAARSNQFISCPWEDSIAVINTRIYIFFKDPSRYHQLPTHPPSRSRIFAELELSLFLEALRISLFWYFSLALRSWKAGYIDAFWAGSPSDRQAISTRDIVFFLGGNLITWKTKKKKKTQNVVVPVVTTLSFLFFFWWVCLGFIWLFVGFVGVLFICLCVLFHSIFNDLFWVCLYF